MSEICFLTSASNAGVDKAAMDFARKQGMKVANVTPFAFAHWMEPASRHPLLITNSIADYADACAAADVTLVTGGGRHTWNEDVARRLMGEEIGGEDMVRRLIGKKTTVVAADIMREEHGLVMPPTSHRQITNAAAYMQQKGFRVANMDLAEFPTRSDGLKASQQNVVAVLERLFNQISIG
jgi:hypothetical protein